MDDKRIVQFRDFGLLVLILFSYQKTLFKEEIYLLIVLFSEFPVGVSKLIYSILYFSWIIKGDLNWLERAFFVDKIRNIVDQFPKFNVTVFDYDSTIYDLILGVKVIIKLLSYNLKNKRA